MHEEEEPGRELRLSSPVEAALSRAGSPADVLRRHGVTVRGRMARCPFHPDKSPSLSLFKGTDGKERWRCHGCDQGGDALDLTAALHGCDVRDLLR